jgi:hypothetical protein
MQFLISETASPASVLGCKSVKYKGTFATSLVAKALSKDGNFSKAFTMSSPRPYGPSME